MYLFSSNLSIQINVININVLIVLGGWANSRAAIRKRIKNYPLKELAISPVIDTQRPLKVVIEISKGNYLGDLALAPFERVLYLEYFYLQLATFAYSPMTKRSHWFRRSTRILCQSNTWVSLRTKVLPLNLCTIARRTKLRCCRAMPFAENQSPVNGPAYPMPQLMVSRWKMNAYRFGFD